MSNTSNNSDDDLSDELLEIQIPRIAQFWMYVVSDALSISCILFILYHILFDRTLRSALHNHVIVLVLIVDLIYELTDIPWIMHYYRFGQPWLQSDMFSRVWAFTDYGLYGTQIILFAWATLERHILIFHDRWVMTKRRCFLVHYLPLIVLPIYSTIYYVIGSFFMPCDGIYSYSFVSGVPMPCLYSNPGFAKFDLLGHQIAPALIIVIASIGLLVRVTWQKFRLHQHLQWRKHRKMTVQLLIISVVYLTFASPWAVVLLAHEFGLPRNIGHSYLLYAAFFSYYTIFSFPFVCCISLSELRLKMKQHILWFRRAPRTVKPEVTHALPRLSHRPVLPTTNWWSHTLHYSGMHAPGERSEWRTVKNDFDSHAMWSEDCKWPGGNEVWLSQSSFTVRARHYALSEWRTRETSTTNTCISFC